MALHVGHLCRSMTNKAVAELERLHDSTVTDLSKRYVAEQVRRAGVPAPRAIGIDEIAIHKSQRYTLLSHHENLTLDGRQALKKPLAANKRLNTAYLWKESFVQWWSYRSERGARAFFERCKQSLRWQRLAPSQRFVKRIERHWGRHRRLLPSRPQGQPRSGGRAEQQDPGHPAQRLWRPR
ncbi:transposase [Xanthomonas theicola]|uniref:transposase n=1 Tax=Xanthomonas theicola TaxID=56464 RepID=UPI001C8DF999|nr:transposase [Xanthomonas theicola]